MQGSADVLTYILLIAGFLVFNYFMQQIAKRAREQQEAAERAARAEAEAAGAGADEVLEDIWGRTPAATPVVQHEPVRKRIALPQARVRQSSHRLFRTRDDLRHAIVVMTVIGPCRALDPHENRH